MELRQLLTTFVVTNTNDSGAGSLRAAILSSDTPHTGADNIDFNIQSNDPNFNPGTQTWTINLQSALPAITHQVTIDGLTQASTGIGYQYPQATTPTIITSSPSTVAAKSGNNEKGLLVVNGGGTSATGFDIAASGVNLRGLIITGFGVGVSVEAGAVGDTIQANEIGKYQVFPVDPQSGQAIPGDPVNLLGSGNSLQGVLLASTNTTVGGVELQDANIIAGNGQQGVSVLLGAHGNQIVGNQIGVVGPAATGDPYFIAGNGSDGVRIADSSNYVGGQVSGDGNIISGNKGNGVNIIGATATRNDVEGNYIGVGPGGGFPLGSGDPGNVGDGVTLENAGSNQIGGSILAAQNVISSNGGAGVRIFNDAGLTSAVNNFIQGNIIGLTADGISILGNAEQGVVLDSANNTVNDLNVISANLEGILISGPGATGNLVNSNLIGTNKTGTGKLGNVNDGIDINGASNNTISGNAKGSQVISGNNVGVLISGTTAKGNQVFGNFIGTDVTGTVDLGNAVQGIEIYNAPSNTIGGITAAKLNLISSNYTGVEIVGAGATNNVLQGNFIGTDITGTLPLGNEVDGVYIHQGADDQSIGGSTAAAGNTIAFNTRDGIRIEDNSTGNPILSNSIFANGGLGIDLVSTGTPPTTPNNLQAAPVLTSATTSFTSTIVTGSLTSTPNTTFTIQFFSNASQSQAGGEGAVLLGKATVVTGSNGVATFTSTLPTLLQSGQYVTATATSSAGNTSGFTTTPITLSPSGGQSQSILVTNTNDSGAGSLRQAILEANSSSSAGAASIVFEIQSSDPNFSPTYQTWTINLLSPLPALTHQVTIDGFTQTQQSNITYLYPQGGTPTAITSAPSTDAALSGNNATPRIVIDGSQSNVSGASNTGFTIDASGVNLRGLIITGFGVGVSVEAGSVGDTIQGNDIGKYLAFPVDPQTGIPLPGLGAETILGEGNSLQGILLASTNTTVGGVETQDGNVIIGNGLQGISILPGAHGNQILGNQIGVVGPSASTGVYFTLGNGSDGILIQDSSNYVGGQVSGDGNVISGNGGDGVHIVGNAATRNDVEGNFIGVGPGGGFILGSANPGNGGDGVTIYSAAANQIGGTSAAAQNVISGNGGAGVRISDNAGGSSAINNLVQGNIIGLTADGTSILGNIGPGVAIYSANNTVNDTNIISANLDGVLLSGPGSIGNVVNGNLIGTNKAGTGKLGNVNDGIDINGASNNTISGNAKGSQVISGNNVGVLISGTTAKGNQVFGNFIGTDVTGTVDLGNAVQGIEINNAPSNTIGGSIATATNLNLISANYTGVEIVGSVATNNVLQGNFIGTDITGTLPLGNETDGVYIHQGASANTTGGSIAAAGNTIAFNTRDGVRIADASNFNPILSNSIFANGGLGIDIVSTGNPQTSPAHVNPPSLTWVASSVSSMIINGTLTASPNLTYTIQFFASSPHDPTGANEGGQYLGELTVTTGTNGIANYTANLPSPLKSGQYVTATATDPNGNTSQFSSPIAPVVGIVQFQMLNYVIDEAAGTATITVTRQPPGIPTTIDYTTGGGTAIPGVDYTKTSGTLTFSTTDMSQTFTIPILVNPQITGNVTTFLTLSNPTDGSTIGNPSSAVLTIVPAVNQFQTPTFSVGEADGLAVVTVTRTSSVGTTTVNYSTANGTAQAGIDYVPTAGTLTFGPGQTVATFTVPILINPLIAGNETINLSLSSPAGGAILGNPATASITIIDDHVDRHGPHAISVQGISGPRGISEVIVTFDEALNPTTAVNLLNYGFSVRTPGRDGKLGTNDDRLIGIRSAIYNPITHSVTLSLATGVKPGSPLELMLNAATNVPSAGVGISDLLGNLLDGNNDGLPGGVFTAKFVAEPAPKPVHAATKAHHPKAKVVKHPVKIISLKSHPRGPSKTTIRHR